MIQLFSEGAYLVDGTTLVKESEAEALKQLTGEVVSKEEASKNTIAYGILRDHNTSGNMEKLQIKFDKLTSHDITFVGIIQTARASGIEKFPVPYVLTNCHNSLCAVGGTINEDDHMFGLTCCKEIWWSLCTTSSGSDPSVRKRNVSWRWKDDPWIRQPYTLWSTWNHGNGRRWTRACKTAS